jgi:hypothetical protein
VKTALRDINFDAVIAHVESYAKSAGEVCDPNIQAELARKRTGAEKWSMLRDFAALAAIFEATAIDQIEIDHPLVQATLRAHHLAGTPMPRIELRAGLDAGPRLAELAAAHPEITWDADEFQVFLVAALLEHGSVEIDLVDEPWLLRWGAAQPAMYVLFLFATLRALGELDAVKDPS